MKFNLKKPCSDCPFRIDCLDGWLGKDRARQIVDGLLVDGCTFTCHKTLDNSKVDQSHCFGALVLMDNGSGPNKMVQIAQRLGICSTEKHENPFVFQSKIEFINHHACNRVKKPHQIE